MGLDTKMIGDVLGVVGGAATGASGALDDATTTATSVMPPIDVGTLAIGSIAGYGVSKAAGWKGWKGALGGAVAAVALRGVLGI